MIATSAEVEYAAFEKARSGLQGRVDSFPKGKLCEPAAGREIMQ